MEVHSAETQTAHAIDRPASAQASSSIRLLFILVLALGLALRLFRLGANELWLDEAHSVFIAATSFPDIIHKLQNDGHPPLYFTLLLMWIKAFGDSETSIRLLSVIFGTACLPAIYWVGRNIINDRVGLMAMFLASINPLYVNYSQEARMYIVLAFLAILSSGFLWMAVMNNRKLLWAAYALFSTFMVYTHIFGWFLLAAGNLFLLLDSRYRHFFWKLILYQAIIVAAFLPFVPITIKQMGQAGQWVRPWWLATPPALAIPKSFECMGVGGNYPPYLRFSHISPVRYISYSVFILLAALALLPYREKREGHSQNIRSGKLYISLCLLAPLMLPFIISFLKPIYLVGRYEINVFPFYALLISYGLRKLHRLALPVILIIALMAGYSLYKFYSIPTPAFEKEAVRHLAAVADDDDVVVVAGLRLCPFEYYAGREGRNFRLLPYPSGMAEHPGWIDYRISRDELAGQSKEIIEVAISESEKGHRVWLLTYPLGWMNEPLYDEFDRRMRAVGQEKKFAIVSFEPQTEAPE